MEKFLASRQHVKRMLRSSLETDTFEEFVSSMEGNVPCRLLHYLTAFLCSEMDVIRFRAIRAVGRVVELCGKGDMEVLREFMRRLMWSLNDESGASGWGAPEAMAESMVHCRALADEYAHIFVSYMRGEGDILQTGPLQRGLLWGIGRLAGARAELLHGLGIAPYLLPFLTSGDGTVRGLAAWAVGILRVEEAWGSLEELLDDGTEVLIDKGTGVLSCRVGDLAEEARARIAAQFQRVECDAGRTLGTRTAGL